MWRRRGRTVVVDAVEGWGSVWWISGGGGAGEEERDGHGGFAALEGFALWDGHLVIWTAWRAVDG